LELGGRKFGPVLKRLHRFPGAKFKFHGRTIGRNIISGGFNGVQNGASGRVQPLERGFTNQIFGGCKLEKAFFGGEDIGSWGNLGGV